MIYVHLIFCVSEYHEWLLSDKVDLLPRLLLPLAGPEEFDDDDTDRLPDELQYLPSDKEREPDSDIRKMLLEALLQVATTYTGRRKRILVVNFLLLL